MNTRYEVILHHFQCILLCFYLTGIAVRAINRPGSQLLGANGRDDGQIVSFLSYTSAESVLPSFHVPLRIHPIFL